MLHSTCTLICLSDWFGESAMSSKSVNLILFALLAQPKKNLFETINHCSVTLRQHLDSKLIFYCRWRSNCRPAVRARAGVSMSRANFQWQIGDVWSRVDSIDALVSAKRLYGQSGCTYAYKTHKHRKWERGRGNGKRQTDKFLRFP